MASLKMLVKRRSSGVEQYIKDMKQSQVTSSRDVKTLRTQLHTRRMELTEEIEREDRIVDGSKRLMGATSDTRAKNQAALELNFSESKIKALQSEIAKINSSLSAYQAEGCDTTQVPLIPLAFKVTHKIDIEASFQEIIADHYHTDPCVLEKPVQQFQHMREAMSQVPRDESGLEALFKYHSHLQLVSKRFIHRNVRHGLTFTWYDAIIGLPTSQQTAVYERACVLFNIGALYSQLAAKVDRGSEEGRAEAVGLLEKAVGVFECVRDKFSNAPSRDLSPDMLSMFADLMRAQAQEIQWEASQSSNTLEGHIDHAHKMQCVADCYSPVREFMEKSKVKGYLPECWVTLVKVKEAHYKGLAHYHAALAHGLVAERLSKPGGISEDLRTELHFLYIESPAELNSDQSPVHVGLMQSHLKSAGISHEFAVNFNSFCRDLHHVLPLTKMLSEAAWVTSLKKEEVDQLVGVACTVAIPSIQASAVRVHSQPPKLSSVKVEDLFHSLGPLPLFSAEQRWTRPRTMSLCSGEGGLGLSVRKSRPVVVSVVDVGGAAEGAGVLEGDWLLAVNGVDCVHLSHQQVVSLIKASSDSVTLTLTTPSVIPTRD